MSGSSGGSGNTSPNSDSRGRTDSDSSSSRDDCNDCNDSGSDSRDAEIQEAKERIEEARRQYEEALEKMKKAEEDIELLDKATEMLEQARQELKEAMNALLELVQDIDHSYCSNMQAVKEVIVAFVGKMTAIFESFDASVNFTSNVNLNPLTGRGNVNEQLVAEKLAALGSFVQILREIQNLESHAIWQGIEIGAVTHAQIDALKALHGIDFIAERHRAVLGDFINGLPSENSMLANRIAFANYVTSLRRGLEMIYGPNSGATISGGYMQITGFPDNFNPHHGIDFIGGEGSTVRSFVNGTIVSSANGRTIIEAIRPSSGETYYVHFLHMSTADTSWAEGNEVRIGDKLGTEARYCVDGVANQFDSHTHIEIAHSKNSGGNPRESSAWPRTAGANRTVNPTDFFNEFWELREAQ